MIAAAFRFILVIVVVSHLNFLKRPAVDSTLVNEVNGKP